LSTVQLLVSTIQPKKPPKFSPLPSVPPYEPPKVNVPKKSRSKRRSERSARAMMMEANQTKPNNSSLLEKLKSKSSRSKNRSLGGGSSTCPLPRSARRSWKISSRLVRLERLLVNLLERRMGLQGGCWVNTRD
jgi:hypothetical protein